MSNRIDLELLSLLYWEEPPPFTAVADRFNEAQARLSEVSEFLIETTHTGDWELFTRRQQLRRYIYWFFHRHYEFIKFDRYKNFPEDLPGLVKLLARHVLDRLPKHLPATH